MWYVIGGIAALIVAFIAWRWTSVSRGARKRDGRILKLMDPIGLRLDAGETVTPEEILEIARQRETRFLLYSVLREMGRAELIPPDFNSSICQAESSLAYWLMHPNELQDPPERMKHVQKVTHLVDGSNTTFHVFRYHMPEGHWGAKDGWLLGLVGPMEEHAEPYSFLPGAFSRAGDTEGSITPSELVAWYVDMLKKKGIVT